MDVRELLKMIKFNLATISLYIIFVMAKAVAQEGEQIDKKVLQMKEIDYKDETSKVKWRAVNDGVMGGRSDGSSFLTEAGNRIFTGEISLENNGGFSSVRTEGGNYDLSVFEGVTARVRGDGRMYYFTARTKGGGMLAFWYPMQTKAGEWLTFKIPFSEMYATSFGRKLNNIPLDTKNITSFGLMLYDKLDGGFNLELESIKVYQNNQSSKK
jgi:NADH dehydrogenase [ubiquinone] 1 alpha subcomplex assembly factor 1